MQLKKVNIILYYQIDRSFDVSRNCLYNSSFVISLSVWINILLLFVNDNYFPQFCDEIWWRFICLFIGYLEIFSRYLKIDLYLWIIIAKNYYLFLFKIYARFEIEEILKFIQVFDIFFSNLNVFVKRSTVRNIFSSHVE